MSRRAPVWAEAAAAGRRGEDLPVAPGGAAGRVRPLRDADVPEVAALHRRIFRDLVWRSAWTVEEYLDRVLCRNPWRDDRLPSLVYEDESGRLAGCLGVMPRPMQIGGRPLRAAVTHSFMVEPGSRSSLAGLSLVREFLSGAQDLTIAEGGTPSRRILERCGGSVSIVYSLRWTRPLRPGRYLLSVLRRRGLPAPAAGLLAPLCAASDAVASLALRRLVPPPAARLKSRPLGNDDLLECLSRLPAERRLWPRYDRDSLAWLLELLEGRTGRGPLRRVAVLDAAGDIAGWYLHYLQAGGVCEVVQVGARRALLGEVLDHLFHSAYRAGAIAVSGQIDPVAFAALAAKGCLFHSDGASWFLIHARDAEVSSSIHRGEAFLTRLEGEWCISP